MLPSYRNQSIDLHSKSIDWFLYEGNTGINLLKEQSFRIQCYRIITICEGKYNDNFHNLINPIFDVIKIWTNEKSEQYVLKRSSFNRFHL